MLRRQAEWQRKRSRLPWEEKLRLSLVMRDALMSWKVPAGSEDSGRGSAEQDR
jgi:hypothetical protein